MQRMETSSACSTCSSRRFSDPDTGSTCTPVSSRIAPSRLPQRAMSESQLGPRLRSAHALLGREGPAPPASWGASALDDLMLGLIPAAASTRSSTSDATLDAAAIPGAARLPEAAAQDLEERHVELSRSLPSAPVPKETPGIRAGGVVPPRGVLSSAAAWQPAAQDRWRDAALSGHAPHPDGVPLPSMEFREQRQSLSPKKASGVLSSSKELADAEVPEIVDLSDAPEVMHEKRPWSLPQQEQEEPETSPMRRCDGSWREAFLVRESAAPEECGASLARVVASSGGDRWTAGDPWQALAEKKPEIMHVHGASRLMHAVACG